VSEHRQTLEGPIIIVTDDVPRLDRIVMSLLILGFIALQFDRGNM
jgi:hypothetical protein